MDLYELAQDYLSDPSGALQTLLATFLNMVMLCEAEIQAGAGYYERSEHRTATRNGYTERGLKTRFGDIQLLKPEFREKPFQTIVFERYSRSWARAHSCHHRVLRQRSIDPKHQDHDETFRDHKHLSGYRIPDDQGT
ncbi:MAG: hypothetical protein HQP72_05910 [Methanoculleus sp.]|nr:hypothetical protein [Methanoculleus sp.]